MFLLRCPSLDSVVRLGSVSYISEQKHSCKGEHGLGLGNYVLETKVQVMHQIAFANRVGQPKTKIRAI